MGNFFLVILIYLLAMVGGTGAYGLMSMFMNALVFAALLAFSWRVVDQYYERGAKAVFFDIDKSVVLILYIGFIAANILREAMVNTEYKFEEFEEGTNTVRQYIDVFRGLVSFFAIGVVYSRLRYQKAFIFLPPLCLAIILGSMFLEAYGYISFNAYIREGVNWKATPTELLLSRPGGFMNANMTAAVAMVWLYMALESERNMPVVIKGICLILAVTICTLAQSRAAVLFLALYALYSLIVERKGGFAISLLVGGLVAVIVMSYLDMDIITSLIERFSERTNKDEHSAHERGRLINLAIDIFQDAPLTGHGLFYLHKEVGASAHNQILEILTNFGLVGFFMYGILYLAFYHKNDLSYLILCIFPTMFFSHNFFENSALQVSLGFAYAQSKAGMIRIIK